MAGRESHRQWAGTSQVGRQQQMRYQQQTQYREEDQRCSTRHHAETKKI
jgi:hypothetical protein